MQVGNRNTSVRHKIGWLQAVILVIAWLIIYSLARDVWQIKSGFDRIGESQERLRVEEGKNEALKQKLGLVLTEDYKEKLIRDKLNMQREGEVIAVMPKNANLGTTAILDEGSHEANWQKWWWLIR